MRSGERAMRCRSTRLRQEAERAEALRAGIVRLLQPESGRKPDAGCVRRMEENDPGSKKASKAGKRHIYVKKRERPL